MTAFRVVVTGATGGLGRTACQMLLRNAWQGAPGFDHLGPSACVEVRGTGRQLQRLEYLKPLGLTAIELDLERASVAQLQNLLEGADAVWHCAALSAPWGAEDAFFAANVRATRRMLEAARRCGVPRFVHVSTPAIYFDFRHREAVEESDRLPRRFVNAYARTKYLAEQEVRYAVQASAGAMAAVVLRPRALFGENDQVLLPRLLRAAQTSGGRLRLPRGGQTLLDLTYLDNAVDALWQATFASVGAEPAVFNITNDEPVRLADALRLLCSHLPTRHQFELASVPYPVAAAAARVQEALALVTHVEPALTRYGVGALAYDMTLAVERAKSPKGLNWRARVSMACALERTAQALSAQLDDALCGAHR